jgi:transcriptional regulator with XRE-family HTH domain
MTAPGPEPLHGWRMRDYDDLIATLRSSWLSQGVSQREIAERIGCSRPTVRALLAGNRTAAIRLLDLADALGYDLALIPRDAEPDVRAMPNGAERPGEHWNARLIREAAERAQVSASISTLAAEAAPPRDPGTVGPENGTGGEWGDYPLSETHPGSGIYE